ncbi:MAG: prolipoprotein diacylglyceryl transferase, partial [Gemmatimonadales bacterium]|nr:prolipoprotein diacylglyceryl transferase [Gemmatimonadales bacterium]
MYPAVVAWLAAHGLEWLAPLVPKPGVLYMVVMAVVAGLGLHRARAGGLPLARGLEAALAGSLGALVGTRLFYVLTRTRFWDLPLAVLADGSRGTASWGAYLGGIGGVLLYEHWQRIPRLSLVDAAASAAPLGDCIGRINCWLAGDDFGRITELPWGIRFPSGSLPWKAHHAAGLIEADAAWSLPVHPLQLLLSALGAVLFVLASRTWLRHHGQPGITLGTYLAAYGATRFPLEFLRDPAAGGAAT